MTGVLLQAGGDLSAVADGVNIVWVMLVSFLIFFMQPGFALLEAGQVRAKNAGNVVMKNMMDWALGVLVYFIVGLGIAGVAAGLSGGGGVAGAFAYISSPGEWIGSYLFGAVFAMTAATIVSGAVAERIDFKAYVVLAIVMTAVIYPVIQGIAWGSGGLLNGGFISQLLGGVTYEDFAGATVVHFLGGIAGLTAAYMVGPRRGRFNDDGSANPIPGHSVVFAIIGTFILAFGWYGFNVGTQATVLSVEGGALAFQGTALGRVALNTTLAMGAGAVASTVVTAIQDGKPDPLFAANGLLAGLVAITGACAHVTWWGGLLIGVVGGAQTPFVYRWVVDSLQIDDVCGVFAVHGSAGAVGTLLIPFLSIPDSGVSGISILGDAWAFAGVNQVLMQFVGISVIGTWTVLTTMATTFAIKAVFGGLRVSEADERLGLDESEHGMSAYPEFGGQTVADGGSQIRGGIRGDGGDVRTDGGTQSTDNAMPVADDTATEAMTTGHAPSDTPDEEAWR